MSEAARPTAMKVRGTAFYRPAVATAYGPKALPHGGYFDTRYQAVKEAKRLIADAERNANET